MSLRDEISFRGLNLLQSTSREEPFSCGSKQAWLLLVFPPVG